MKCPNCKSIVRAEETYDTEWTENRYYDCVEGTCPICDKIWRWTEVYVFDHIEDVEELNENPHY